MNAASPEPANRAPTHPNIDHEEAPKASTGLRLLKILGAVAAGIAAATAPPSQGGHNCGGCPMCMPPPIRRPEKKEDEDDDGDKE